MRKFNEVIEDVKAPNIQSLWLNEGSLSYYGKNGWESIGGSESSDKSKSSIKEITYSELKEMRDNDKLSPGALYRITDYICTTTQENTISAGNKFDIISTIFYHLYLYIFYLKIAYSIFYFMLFTFYYYY